MTSLKAETSHPSPAGSASPTRLPFAFAQDQGVVLDGARLIVGPAATMTGLREARRRAGAALDVSEVDQDAFDAALAQLYHSAGTGQASGEPAVLFDLEDAAAAGRQRDLLDDPGDAPVIQLVNRLLRQAVMAGASDLHIEPHEGGLRVRMRVDGFLQSMMDRTDVPVKRIVSRLKVMAGLDIAETRLPQDGRIALSMGGRMIDTRVSSLPGHYGERVVLRILDRSAGLMPLEALGLTAEHQALLERLSALPNGIILATGPTGSGKTTTLYSLLKLADRDERNIVTVEDPIEYDLPGISQSQINAEIGMTFAAGLRATLRQDPDVILVGEIRDGETARTATQAALTGHLVFSSLHANGSVGAVVRLRDLGIEDFMIAATLRGVIAQRLLRRLCPACKRTPRRPPRKRGCSHATPCPFPCRSARPPRTAAPVAARPAMPGGWAFSRSSKSAPRCAMRSPPMPAEAEMTALALRAGQTLFGQGLAAAARGEVSLSETLRVVGDVA